MNVENRLVGGRAVVLQNVVGGGAGGLHHRPAKPRQYSSEGRRRVVGKLVELGPALLGNDQRVAGRERSDVEERKNVLVFIDLVTGDIAGENFVENGRLVLAHGRLLGSGAGRVGAGQVGAERFYAQPRGRPSV